MSDEDKQALQNLLAYSSVANGGVPAKAWLKALMVLAQWELDHDCN